MSTISNRVIKLQDVEWQKLHFIQKENFKEWIDLGDEKLIASILKYQFVDPFKVWENEGIIYCLDGYHRVQDLKQLKARGEDIPDLLPAVFVECENEKQAAELVLVYSSYYAKITQQGLWDFVAMNAIDWETVKEGISLPDFSFDRFEQQFDIYGIADKEGEDDEEPLPEESIVNAGDLFEINGHRIICSSFQEEQDVLTLMEGEKARIINCDPPYNLPANFFLKDNKQTHNHKDFAMAAGEMTDDEFADFLELVMRRSVANSVEGAIHYIFMDFRHAWHMCEAGRRVYGSPMPKQVCVWNKDMMANGSFYRAKHELCFIFSTDAAKALWNKDLIDEGGNFYKQENEWCFIFKNGDAAPHLSHLEMKDRIRTNVWRYPSAVSRANPDRFELKNHPTPKPVAMIADSILDTTNPGDIVIDWFLGSGTCLIACEKTGRRGRFTEIEPRYVQADINRFIKYCDKNGKQISFKHLNGDLTIEDFRSTITVS